MNAPEAKSQSPRPRPVSSLPSGPRGGRGHPPADVDVRRDDARTMRRGATTAIAAAARRAVARDAAASSARRAGEGAGGGIGTRWRGSRWGSMESASTSVRGFVGGSSALMHGHGKDDPNAETIDVTFIEKDGTETKVKVRARRSIGLSPRPATPRTRRRSCRPRCSPSRPGRSDRERVGQSNVSPVKQTLKGKLG